MPKDMLWTELLFSFFPVDKENFRLQLVVRFLFLFLVWLTGLTVYSLNGLGTNYLFDSNTYILVFGMFLLTLVGSFYVQNTLQKILVNFRSLLKLDDEEYNSFSKRLKQYAFSILPCVVVSIILTFFTGTIPTVQRLFIAGLDLIDLWN